MTAFPVQAADLPAPVGEDQFPQQSDAMAELGWKLFWDPILSGNRNIACATCHHPRFGTSDGIALGLGEGGTGLGPARRADPDNPPEQHVPRNAPALFNLGATDFVTLFHDGRIEVDPSRKGGLRTPLDDDMTLGFSGILSAQTMFPVLSQDEMAGHYSENDVAAAVRRGELTGPGGAWDLITRRVAAIPAYSDGFVAAVTGVTNGADLRFTHVSDAIAAFIAMEWRADDSPFDAHLRGTTPLTGAALAGMRLFYGRAGCADCHAGPFQTDHGFHAMGDIQIGPGKAARFESHRRDDGRLRVTGRPADAFAFRTPSLRNVMATAPYGHAGAISDLRLYLAHHADPWRLGPTEPAPKTVMTPLPGHDIRASDDAAGRAAILAARAHPAIDLSENDLDLLMAFLDSLTDPTALAGRRGIPDTVPSGLPIDR